MSRKVFFFTILILLLALSVLFFACTRNGTVETFSLTLNAYTLSWEEVDAAARYDLVCTLPDQSGYTLQLNATTFSVPQTAAGDYVYQVSAYNKDGELLAKSNLALYHLGKGSHLDPILIGTVSELQSITTGTYQVNFHGTKVQAPIYYKLTADLDLAGVTMTPIGNNSNHFCGSFDGDNHTIKNLAIRTTNADARMGLFGYVSCAVIKNLRLQDAKMTISANKNTASGGLEYGFIAAYADNSLIDNCHVTGTAEILKGVTTTGSNTADVGGLVGYMLGGKLFASSFNGELFAQYSRIRMGGLIGRVQSDNSFVMANCLSVATVKGVATAVDASKKDHVARVGVLAGILSNAEKVICNIAIGSATAETNVTGSTQSYLKDFITAGVFGSTGGEGSSITVPITNLFYSADTLSAVSGTYPNLGLGNTAYGLTDEALKEYTSYRINDAYVLDFANFWQLDGNYPTLRGNAQSVTHEDVTVTVHDQVSGKEISFSLNDTFLPTYFYVTIQNVTRYYAGYYLSDLLSGVGVTFTGAKEAVVSAEGTAPVTLVVGNEGVLTSAYVTYGSFGTYGKPADLYEGIRLINGGTKETFDITKKNITVTIVPRETETENQ